MWKWCICVGQCEWVEIERSIWYFGEWNLDNCRFQWDEENIESDSAYQNAINSRLWTLFYTSCIFGWSQDTIFFFVCEVKVLNNENEGLCPDYNLRENEDKISINNVCHIHAVYPRVSSSRGALFTSAWTFTPRHRVPHFPSE